MKKFLKLFTVFMLLAVSFIVASCDNKNNNANAIMHSIALENTCSDVEVSTSVVKNVDGAPQKVAVEYGKEYEEGLNVYISINNNSERKIEVSVYLADKVNKTETVSNKSSKSISGVELTANLKIVVKESVATTAKLTINEDLSKNSQTAVNKVHAYDPDDADLRDYSNNEEIALGKKMKIYEFNYASPVHFVVTHNGTTVVDKYYSTIIDMQKGHDEFFDLVVEGDIVITVTNVDKIPGQDLTLHVEGDQTIGWVYVGYTDIHDGAALDEGEQTFTVYAQDTTKNLKVVIKVGTEEIVNETITLEKDYTIDVTADVYFTFTVSDKEVVKEKYTVTVTNSLNDTNVTANIRYLDAAMTPVDIVSGNSYDAGTVLFVQIINAANYKVKVVCKKGTEVVDSTEVDAKPVDDDASYGGLMGVEVDGNLVFEITKVEANSQPTSYSVTVNNENNHTLQCFYGTSMTDLENGGTIAAGTYNFTIGAFYPEDDVVISFYVGGTLIGTVEVSAWDEATQDFNNVTVNGNVVITVTNK